MKYLLKMKCLTGEVSDIKEVFDEADYMFDFMNKEFFDGEMNEQLKSEILKNKKYSNDWLELNITEVEDNFYIRDDNVEYFARAYVAIRTGNKAGLSLEVVQNHNKDIHWKNIEISCGDNIDGSVRSVITIGGIDEQRGAIEALRDFGLQIVKMANKIEDETPG